MTKNKTNTREEINSNEEAIKSQVLDTIEKNGKIFNDFNLEKISELLNSFFYDNKDGENKEIQKILNDETLDDEQKEKLVSKISKEYQISEILSYTLIRFFKNISVDTLSTFREFLNNSAEKDYSIKRKAIALLLQLKDNYKNVPPFEEKVVLMSKDFSTGNRYEKEFIAYIPRNYKKLKDEQILFLTTLFLYNTKQYKYISKNKKGNDLLRETDYDIIFIDFIKSLEGKNINEVLNYLHIN